MMGGMGDATEPGIPTAIVVRQFFGKASYVDHTYNPVAEQWMMKGLCGQVDPEVFFPPQRRIRQAGATDLQRVSRDGSMSRVCDQPAADWWDLGRVDRESTGSRAEGAGMEGAETTDRERRDAEEEKWVSEAEGQAALREEMMRWVARDLGQAHVPIPVIGKVLDEIDRQAAELTGERADEL